MLNAATDLVKNLRNEAATAWAVDKNDTTLIEGFEGCRLKAYLDIAGVPTIGWGNTRYENGIRVKMGDTITQARADSLLLFKLKEFEAEVRSLVRVAITDNQGAALLSFDYNTGSLAGSTLLKKLNAGDYNGAADEFLKWNKVTKNGEKKIADVLVKRRAAEQKLFKTPS
ncbi:lysozyme [Mucilaginibacter sp.]|uniref:lysozyme n=1 Tax=Mucilaginibacter sp. TaxID=1882438 RepID=UPI003264412A